MKQAKKLNCQYCINVDEETAAQIEQIAEYCQRKPAELLRLIRASALRDEWAKIQRQEHPENNTAPTLARFTI